MTEPGGSARDTQTPQRIQLRRSRGWRKPRAAVTVARPGRWGNPFRWDSGGSGRPIQSPEQARAQVVAEFEAMLTDPASRARHGYPSDAEIRDGLSGRDLACWCPLDQPCHADVLLRIANAVEE